MPSHRLIVTSTLAGVAIAVFTAGCGGGSPAAQTAPTALVAYAHCMRSHGVPGFPDPVPGEGIPKAAVISLGASRQITAASSACQHLMPASGLGPQTTAQSTRTRLTGALTFSTCMRDHGFRDFPDPTHQGQLTPAMVTAAGIDLHQPRILQAGLACAPITHGVITRAAVQRAVSGG